MAEKTFHCSVVTPERAILETDGVTFVALPAHDGEQGILRGRAPLLCQVGIGVLRVETAEKRHLFYVDRGFAQMVDDRLTVLTEAARSPTELELEHVEAELQAAKELPIQGGESLWVDDRMLAIQRATTKLRVANEKED
ncbi:MAG: ATP synthase F1 subunit epsilon [Acidobacteriota bacterium]